MFICRDCQEDIGIDAWYQLESYGYCEICHKVGACVDWHGLLTPKKSKEKTS